MADVFTASRRSEIMARVRSRGNAATENRLIKVLRKYGVRGWRRHVAIQGNPDFVFPKERVAVFVDGCFWHSCPEHGSVPRSNRIFWQTKLARNRARDREVKRLLTIKGWQVVRIWQHELVRRKEKRLVGKIVRVLNAPSSH
jgi:DNA mismatch endonuclease, patch repair protein